MQDALQLPELMNVIGRHLTRKDLIQCILVSTHWRDLFVPHLWQTLSLDDTTYIASNPESARLILAHYGHHIRSLELKNTDLIDHCGLSCTNLTHLQFDQTNAIRQRRRPQDPPPVWTPTDQWSLLILIERNPALRSLELVIRVPVDAVRVAEVLGSLLGLERLQLDGAELERLGVFWSLLKTNRCLRWANFKDWAIFRNPVVQDPPQQDQQQPNDVINVRKLFLTGCGSPLSLAHSFPELEFLSYFKITKSNARDLEYKLSKGLCPKLALLEVVDTMSHLDGILQHAPPLRYFSLMSGTFPNDLLLPVDVPRLYKEIMQSLLALHSLTLRRLVPLKDTDGLLMSVLEACPNLVEFYSMVPVELNRFLAIHHLPPRIEKMTMRLEVDGANVVLDEEHVRIQGEILRKLSRSYSLTRFTVHGAITTSDAGGTLVLDLIQGLGQLDTANTMRQLKYFFLFGREFSFDGTRWGMHSLAEKLIQLPELLNVIGTHRSRHDLTNASECRSTGATYSLRTCGDIYPWKPLPASTSTTPFASEILAQYSHHVRSLELENIKLIDSYDISFTNLSHLMYDERMNDNLHLHHELEDVNPTWTEADILREFLYLETLGLDGPDFEHESGLAIGYLQNWSQNRLAVEPRHHLQDKNNVINVHRLSLSGCGSVHSLVHSFPVLEALDIYQISDLNAQDLVTLLAKGHALKLRRLHVIEKTTHLDKILEHAPALEYFALSNGQIASKLGSPIPLPGYEIFSYRPMRGLPHIVFANIMNNILTVHVQNLQEFVFTPNMPFKDQKGLLMQLLEACPNLTRFYCMVPVDLAKFLEVEAVAPRLEELSLSLVLPRADELSEREKLQREEQFLDRLNCNVPFIVDPDLQPGDIPTTLSI
ncbi:hypothetical protein BG006_010598 [Podila minutissima]|uniref:F-box domain-containing protein n=1 Tax=Podila minutissima TaxID=64525 RepID=A0A9P5VPS7_9FUNG|nr:hypothetical protein BG006_010598 [Podila minutissima]